jgi:hypothetical protein
MSITLMQYANPRGYFRETGPHSNLATQNPIHKDIDLYKTAVYTKDMCAFEFCNQGSGYWAAMD